MPTESINRRLSRWVAGLGFPDIPPEVLDRARGVTLQGLSSCLLGHEFPETKQAIRLVEEEELGCEVMERLAADFVPTILARGFHAGALFSVFGAAAAVAKIMGLNADQVHGALAQCVNLAAGNLEGGRSGGRSVREGAAVRNALLAVGLARAATRFLKVKPASISPTPETEMGT